MFWVLGLAVVFAAAGTPLDWAVGEGPAAVAWAKRKKPKRTSKRKRRTKKPSSDAAPATVAPAPASNLVPTTQFRGPTRIDFDDRLIQGQTNKSGAVYLFDRKETGISSMVRRRKSFRHLTIQTVYDR